jgi:hypothetical protein
VREAVGKHIGITGRRARDELKVKDVDASERVPHAAADMHADFDVVVPLVLIDPEIVRMTLFSMRERA